MNYCSICKKEFKNIDLHNKMVHEDKEEVKKDTKETNSVKSTEVDSIEAINKKISELSNVIEMIAKKIDNKETGKDDSFKKDIDQKDVDCAKRKRSDVDSRIVDIVDEVLGEDFGVEISEFKDRPGFLFTIVVPTRLSDKKMSSRPVLDEDGKYKYDKNGSVIEEDYYPEDRRSRVIAGYQSFDSVRDHTEKVRSYIVSYFTKMNKPIPEFKLK